MKNILLRGGKAGFRKLFQLTPMLVMSLLFCLATLYSQDSVNFIISQMKHHSLSLLMFRWGVILTIAMSWDYLIHTMALAYKFSSEKVMNLKAQRNRIVIWLIIFELLICEHIVTEFIHLAVRS